MQREGNEHISFIDTQHVTVGQCAAVIRLAQELEQHPEWTIRIGLKQVVLSQPMVVQMHFVWQVSQMKRMNNVRKEET